MREIRNQRVAVIGMAKSGIAAVQLLRAKGATAIGVDQNAGVNLPGLNIDIRPQTAESLADAELVVLSPGVPADALELQDVRRRGVPVIGDVELASWYLNGPIIGVTGANGKTTTTAMIGHILKQSGIDCQVGGNIGTPLASMIGSSSEHRWNVLELSSFQLETVESFRAQIAVVLNVTPDHLDRHYTFEAYAAAKARLLENQQPTDFAVLNADDPTTVGFAEKTRARVLWFSLARPVTPGLYLDDRRLFFDGEPYLTVEEIPLQGMHNVENTMAASAAARLAGAPLDRIAAAVRTFPGVEHRLEFVRELNGVRYFNDSKATNVDATEKAIDAFPGGLWIILGGKDKNSDYTVLRDKLRRKARRVLLIGAAANKIAEQLGQEIPSEHAGTVEQAVRIGARDAGAGEVVLLAPACASFDQFQNYEHRGRVFKAAVMEL